MQTTQGIVIAQAAVDELRRQRVLLPPVVALEKLCATVATREQREVCRLLTAPLSTGQRTALDQLLQPFFSAATNRPTAAKAWQLIELKAVTTLIPHVATLGWWFSCSCAPISCIKMDRLFNL